MIRRTYQFRANRDAEAARLKREGYRVVKRSARNVTLSPDYVADYMGSPSPNGFGGSSPEYFATVYLLETR